MVFCVINNFQNLLIAEKGCVPMRKKYGFTKAALLISLLTVLFAMMGCSSDKSYIVPPAETGEWVVTYTEDGAAYLKNSVSGREMRRAYETGPDGTWIELDLTVLVDDLNREIMEAAQFTPPNAAESQEENPIARTNIKTTAFTPQSKRDKVTIPGTERVVAGDAVGPATIKYGRSTTVSETFQGGLSFTAVIKDAIRIKAPTFNFSWSKSETTSTTLEEEFPVPAGYLGYVEFTPYYYELKGYIIEQTIVTETGDIINSKRYDNIIGYSPMKLDSFAYGRSQLICEPFP